MFDVYLYVYDLSCGIAKTLSPLILGKQIEGIWHTGVVLHNKEYFYGSHGISFCAPGHTGIGNPIQKLYMGQTSVTESQLSSYLEDLARTTFQGGHYRLFDHNCNTFSNHLCTYLTHKPIPEHIVALPSDITSTPFGAVLKPALNTLAAGLDNVPQFGLEAANAKNSNNHCVEEIQRSFLPVLFDEPLPSDMVPHRVHLLWPEDGPSSQAELTASVVRMALESNSAIQLGPEHYSLLALGNLATADQCRVVCEIFRLAIWRDPNLLTAMLTDPGRHLHRLADEKLPTSNPEEVLDLTVSKAKVLCNYLGLSQDISMEGNQDLLIEVQPILHICLLLLGHDDYKLPVSGTVTLLPDHRYAGLALAHNLALSMRLSDDDALQLGTFLIHLAVIQEKSYKQPIEATYLLRAIYFLVVRFPMLADLARAYDLRGCLTVVMNEATDPDNNNTTVAAAKNAKVTPLVTANTGRNGSNGSSCDSTSIDYLIATQLLDYLSIEEGEAP